MSNVLYDKANSESKEVSNSPLILIIDNDKSFSVSLAFQLESIGYRTVYLDDLTKLETTIRNYTPRGILFDLAFKNSNPTISSFLKTLREKDEIQCPIIYLSALDNINTRLDAVRSSGTGFLNKSFTFNDLKYTMDLAIPVHKNTNYKVLIIDDDKNMNAYCTAILENAGIKISCLESSEDLFQDIINFDPDVILMDMYMPNISGLELACIIRQNAMFTSLPIVIMSGETDINKQFLMRSVGADDFILKPFKPHHLVEIILNRIQRSRQTKKRMNSDGLTGLLLFPKVKEQISNLLESCIRYNLQFSIAFIDIDHFKHVNDTYGHLVGDQILRDFADFLISRLRKSDIITRYGGEEFAIVFPYTNGDNAILALNSIRDSFSKIVQHAEDIEFNISFSAGISTVNEHHDLDALLESADQALYRAKENGGNTIYLAD